MVGVSDPELKGNRSMGWRLLGGLAAGYLASTIVVSVLLAVMALSLREVADPGVLRTVVLGVALALGVADLLGRTPHANRQVPQRFARDVRPLARGLLWGFDLGLLVTTQKTTSLLWVAVFGLALVAPPAAILPALLAAGVAYLGGVFVLSLAGGADITRLDFGRFLIPALQRTAGVLLVGVAVVGLAT